MSPDTTSWVLLGFLRVVKPRISRTKLKKLQFSRKKATLGTSKRTRKFSGKIELMVRHGHIPQRDNRTFRLRPQRSAMDHKLGSSFSLTLDVVARDLSETRELDVIGRGHKCRNYRVTRKLDGSRIQNSCIYNYRPFNFAQHSA